MIIPIRVDDGKLQELMEALNIQRDEYSQTVFLTSVAATCTMMIEDKNGEFLKIMADIVSSPEFKSAMEAAKCFMEMLEKLE